MWACGGKRGKSAISGAGEREEGDGQMANDFIVKISGRHAADSEERGEEGRFHNDLPPR